jgi:hypothetical protein
VKDRPLPGELYRDDETGDLFEIIGVGKDATTSKEMVIYRVRGAHPPDPILLDLQKWTEALELKVLKLVALAKP